MAQYTPARVGNAGLNPSMAAVGVNDTFQYPSNAAAVWLEVVNDGASPDSVTVRSQASPSDGLAAADKSVNVPAGERRLIRISQAFRGADGVVAVDHSYTTSVAASVFYI